MRSKITFITMVLLFSTAIILSARPIQIRMGSVAPDNSIYAELLRELAAEWAEISDGQVELKIYFSGFKDDSDLIRKIRINQLQAGVVTGFGLQDLYHNVLGLSVPALIQTDGELSYVLEEIRPHVQEKLDEKRFELLSWSKAGWIYFFTREPAVYPAQLEDQKIASLGTGSAADMLDAFKVVGFDPVPVPVNETLPALVSGMADAVFATPIAVAAGQWFGVLKHMTDMKIAPFVGGIVFSQRAWRRIPEELRPELRAAVERIAGELDEELAALEAEALREMEKRGLDRHPVPPDAREEWEKRFETAIDWASGKVYDESFVDLIATHLEEYRRRK